MDLKEAVKKVHQGVVDFGIVPGIDSPRGIREPSANGLINVEHIRYFCPTVFVHFQLLVTINFKRAVL